MKRSTEGIAAHGPELVRDSEAYRKKRLEIRLDVIARYSRAYGAASWWERLVLLLKIEWEIWRERGRWHPGHSLYARASVRANSDG